MSSYCASACKALGHTEWENTLVCAGQGAIGTFVTVAFWTGNVPLAVTHTIVSAAATLVNAFVIPFIQNMLKLEDDTVSLSTEFLKRMALVVAADQVLKYLQQPRIHLLTAAVFNAVIILLTYLWDQRRLPNVESPALMFVGPRIITLKI